MSLGAPLDSRAEYSQVRRRIQGLAGCLIPSDSTVIVVSKGDQELLSLDGSNGWHFPRTEDGKYAGHHPKNGREAISHLEQLRAAGGEYFVLPSTYFWWLEHYPELAGHLRSRYRLLADCPDTCLIYELRERGPNARPETTKPSRASAPAVRSNGARAQNPLLPSIRRLIDSLLPPGKPVAVVSDGDAELLSLGRAGTHFPDDASGAHRPIDAMTSDALRAQLAALRTRGIRYFVVPDTNRRQVERCRPLIQYLEQSCRSVAARGGICVIYELGPDGEASEPSVHARPTAVEGSPPSSSVGSRGPLGRIVGAIRRNRGGADV